jgi:hypothetical protein
MTIQNHTKSFTSMMIIKLDQHFIILKKSWMKKHDVNYHDHDDSILFYFDYCSHLEAFNHSYSNKSNQIQTKKKVSFSKEIFFDQSKIIENKEIKIFLEKINNSSKMILKRSTSIEFNERLNERSKRLIERRRIRLAAGLDFGHVGQPDPIQSSGWTKNFVRRVGSGFSYCSTFKSDSRNCPKS